MARRGPDPLGSSDSTTTTYGGERFSCRMDRSAVESRIRAPKMVRYGRWMQHDTMRREKGSPGCRMQLPAVRKSRERVFCFGSLMTTRCMGREGRGRGGSPRGTSGLWPGRDWDMHAAREDAHLKRRERVVVISRGCTHFRTPGY